MDLTAGHKAIIQILFAGGEEFTVEKLRTRLRELNKQEVNQELRMTASCSSEELLTMLMRADKELQNIGLKISIYNGTIELLAGPVKGKELSAYLAERCKANPSTISENNLEILACIAFKQPIMQAEIDRIFDGDKRWQTMRLDGFGFIEAITDRTGHKKWITTAQFNSKYGSPEELKRMCEKHKY